MLSEYKTAQVNFLLRNHMNICELNYQGVINKYLIIERSPAPRQVFQACAHVSRGS